MRANIAAKDRELYDLQARIQQLSETKPQVRSKPYGGSCWVLIVRSMLCSLPRRTQAKPRATKANSCASVWPIRR